MLATHAQLTLRGMACASVKVPEAKRIPEIASAYNNYVLAKHPGKSVPFPLRSAMFQHGVSHSFIIIFQIG